MDNKKKKQATVLNSRQKKYLKGLAHHLDGLIFIGKEGLSEAVISATEQELLRHELIKVKIGNNSDADKHIVAERLPAATSSALVQLIGKTVILYRPNPKLDTEKRIKLPK
ncbi:MAG: ribosome assembly RNA-binding protein YhbY [Desulfobulbaceae bacterium]|uniref:Ribosome assembly RNA-binding protein YhbY n=1 Tax=Candidatus Desulfatifera sulfidica TaxID=2841691 RepID=A0A8J6N8E7_9BACT|nr:ribosome assembly RNA-binding protein YhbY [Candidatus Desulfatifera sulfidica]